MAIERGEIYRVGLEPTIGSAPQGDARPCVALSPGACNRRLSTLGVAPLSSSPRPLPPLIFVRPSAGRPTSTALCSRLRAIDKRRLLGLPAPRLSAEVLDEVEKDIR